MKYLPVYTVILSIFVLTISIMFRSTVKETVYQVKTPSYVTNSLELTSDKQFIEVDRNGNVTIK